MAQLSCPIEPIEEGDGEQNEETYKKIDQGIRLAKLQFLLKRDELQTESEDRALNPEVARQVHSAYIDLCTILFEIRNFEKLIEAVSSGRINVKDANLQGLNPDDKQGQQLIWEMPMELRSHIEQLINILRKDPNILCETLLRGKYLDSKKTQINASICQSIFYSIFGNCFHLADERLLFKFIEQLCKVQFQNENEINLHVEPFPMTLLLTYLKYLYLFIIFNPSSTYGRPYLVSVLKDLITYVLQEPNVNLEMDPEKKALLEIGRNSLPILGNSSQSQLLEKIAHRFISQVIDTMENLPYGIRWMAKMVLRIALAKDPEMSDVSKRNLVVAVLFENFMIPSILRPEQYGVIAGYGIGHRERNNLIQISRLILEIVKFQRGPHNTDLEKRLVKFFTDVVDVEEPGEYFGAVTEDENERMVLSYNDLMIILEIVFQNQSPQMANSAILKHIKYVQSVSPGDGMRFIIVNSEPSSAPIKKSEGPKGLKEAKERLSTILKVLDQLCGVMHTPSIIKILERQMARNRTFQHNVLESQLSETIRALRELPGEYKINNYSKLLDAISHDYEKRTIARTKESITQLVTLSHLQRQITELRSKRKLYSDYLTHLRCREFREKGFDSLQTRFIEEFARKFSARREQCMCTVNLHEIRTYYCQECTKRSYVVKKFMMQTRDMVLGHGIWAESTEGEIDDAVRALQRNVMTQLFVYTFPQCTEDATFTALSMEKFNQINIFKLYIPEKYANQAPWELAQKELKKINLFRSPNDKLQCILDTWNIIFNYIRPLSFAGPDDYLPIMSYVILKSQISYVKSNITFVTLYCNLDESEEIAFMNFKASLEILTKLLQGSFSEELRESLGQDSVRFAQLKHHASVELQKKKRRKPQRVSSEGFTITETTLHELMEEADKRGGKEDNEYLNRIRSKTKPSVFEVYPEQTERKFSM